MRTPKEFVGVATTIATLAFSAPAIPPPVSLLNATSSVLTTTIPTIPIDARFHLDDYYTHSPLPPNPLLLCALNAMSTIALLPWTSRSPSRQFQFPLQYQTPEQATVYMQITPQPPATETENRFLIWGIYGAMWNVISEELFVESGFHVSLGMREVGRINFSKRSILNPASVLFLPGHENGTGMTNTAAHLETNNDNANAEIIISPLLPTAKALDFLSIFLTLFDTLRTIAPLRATAPVGERTFEIQPRGVNVKMVVTAVEGEKFEWGHVVEVVRRVGGWVVEMEEKGDRGEGGREVEVEVKVGGEVVGRAKVEGV